MKSADTAVRSRSRTDAARSSTRMDAALAVLRLVVGAIFIAHGAQKLFVFGIDGVSGGFAQMGIPMASVAGPLTALVEFFGGIALAAGLLTRVAGIGLAVIMAGAIGMVHLSAGFFAPQGLEFPLALMAVALSIALVGAGRYSLDHVLAVRRSRS